MTQGAIGKTSLLNAQVVQVKGLEAEMPVFSLINKCDCGEIKK